jgi:hypothetical protein
VLGVHLSKRAALALGVLLSGCGSFLPSFEGPLGIGSWIHDMPVKEAVRQTQCELTDFLRQPEYRMMLDPAGTAQLQLWLQTDTMGNVAFIGVDLNKIGLPALANLIAQSNKAPSLQLSGQATGTIKSQLELNIPQKPVVPPCDPLGVSKLSGGENLIAPLGLQSFLNEFVKKYAESIQANPTACMTKLTLQTQFVLVVDTKAGFNPLVGTAYILPISGLNGEFQVKFAHSLQIALALNPRYCPNQNRPPPVSSPRI